MGKKVTIPIIGLVIGCLLIAGCQSYTRQSKVTEPNPAVINVDDVAGDPTAYSGIIAISGVVSYVKSGESVFGIIDVREYKLCGIVTCAANEIQVSVPLSRYSGELPEVEDEVLVYGEIVEVDGDYVLDVLQVKRGNKVILKLENS